jgi:hypothetical protein
MKDQADPYGRGGYCIVVAMHGDKSREAEVLRNFRDEYLEGNIFGEKIIDLYYRLSPKLNRNLERTSYTGKAVSRVLSSLSNAVELFLL